MDKASLLCDLNISPNFIINYFILFVNRHIYFFDVLCYNICERSDNVTKEEIYGILAMEDEDERESAIDTMSARDGEALSTIETLTADNENLRSDVAERDEQISKLSKDIDVWKKRVDRLSDVNRAGFVEDKMEKDFKSLEDYFYKE
nr:MAG TPA: cell division protein [Caudoviricetes sp.]